MALSGRFRSDRTLEFGANEVTGAVGDSLTVLPLVIALGLLTSVSVPHVLLVFGVFQIVWGVRYGLPLSVEPMKALTALAVAGVLTYGELALAGLLLGGLLLVVGLTETLARVERWVGEPVIRGVQFAVGLLLLETGLRLAVSDPPLAAVGLVLTVIAAVLGHENAAALAVLAVSLAIASLSSGLPTPQWPGLPPVPALTQAQAGRLTSGVAAQLAMTVGNAALATSMLVTDLFDAEVTPDELSTSMGLMNLCSVPVGGIPMCHGCDGVAGKYEFGARTGGANVVLGVCYLTAALFVSTALLGAFPLAMLGVLLAVVAISLSWNVRRSTAPWLSVGIGVVALVTNLGLAFVLGVVVHLLLAGDRYILVRSNEQ